jgi:FtsP/CotA-like multicopper oxidase with cupredoxin domain
MLMKRRDFLQLSAVAAVYICYGCGSNGDGRFQNESNNKNSTIDKRVDDFTKLPIPKINRGYLQDNVRHYDLTVMSSKTKFFKDTDSMTYGINSNYLGETLLLRNDEEVSINFLNRLDETTTMHGHGMHVPAVMDGGPHQKIAPNATWSARYRVNQNACMNWYHPHLMGETARQVYMGLAGVIIIEDTLSDSLDIPKRYGIDDIPLILQDKNFDSKGEIDYSPGMMDIMMGYKGDIYLTNGAIKPYFECEAKENRFRILNGSNSSIYTLTFSDKRDFYVIATDNSFLENRVTTNNIRLSPGERLEIVVDLSDDKGREISLIDSSKNAIFLNIRVSKDATIVTKTPSSLTKLERDSIETVARTREFVFSGRMGRLMINGKRMDMDRVDERVPVDQVEIWEVKNSMMMSHNFHIHATHFIVLERNGSDKNVLEYEKGYKDTVFLGSGDSVKLLVKMKDYTDVENPYMYHCHFLEHEDAGMMGQFIVV